MKKHHYKFFFLFSLFSFIVCCSHQGQKKEESVSPHEGLWRMSMNLNGKVLPFNFDLKKNNDSWTMVIQNAEERIVVDDILHRNDSLIINLPVFESSFYLAVEEPGLLQGEWVNYYKSNDYKISVKAIFNESSRFPSKAPLSKLELKSRYKVIFGEGEQSYPAIGLFRQTGSLIKGTFATETGDYRHLAGSVTADSLFLSTFDGSHAFLFEAKVKGGSLVGSFLSGTHYKTTWKAEPDSSFQLRSPDSLTFIKDGFESFDFSLPDMEGKMVSPKDKRFNGKVLIVQIMGTWCPNCLDETYFLSDLYKQYQKDGLEVVALAFERTRSKERAISNIKALKKRTGAQYTMLLGGSSREETAEGALPMLNHIMSYPTAIFIDKQGEVRKIHTGFYGPGTGEYYEKFSNETDSLVKALLSEAI